MKIAVNGIGIAGPTLAYWLGKTGHEVLLIEQAPRLRSGGYLIDFWGIGYDIVERMGLLSQVRAMGYQVKEVRFVDSHGRKRGGFGVDVFRRLTQDRFISLRRSDLSAAIYQAVDGRVETIFGDSVANLENRGDRMRVSFDHATARDVDLVIGADGLHSRVRQLAFGDEADFEVSLGYHVAAFAIPGYRPRDELVYVSYGMPGRQVSRFSMREDLTLCLFVFRDEYLRGREPCSEAERRSVLKTVFGDAGWECPRILEGLQQAGTLYFDRVSQIRMNRWAEGRVALVGDAAACVSLLAGEGTGLAIAGAYTLAGELHDSGGDYSAAFAGYQDRMMGFLARKQQTAAKFASSFAPRTTFGIGFRNLVTRLLRVPFVAEFFIGRDLRDEIQLPDYRFGQTV